MGEKVNEMYSYGNGIVVSRDKIEEISNEFIGIIKKELPEEAQNITVIDSVLSHVEKEIHLKKTQVIAFFRRYPVRNEI